MYSSKIWAGIEFCYAIYISFIIETNIDNHSITIYITATTILALLKKPYHRIIAITDQDLTLYAALDSSDNQQIQRKLHYAFLKQAPAIWKHLQCLDSFVLCDEELV